jgi:hypothetical protein
MDVHPPHSPIHTWRDFFIYLTTITVGLLIALGLEGAVESMHKHHLRHQAETNLRDEMLSNRKTLAGDEKQLDGAEKQAENNLRLIEAFKSHHEISEKLNFRWEWNGLDTAAWDTARNTGAIALMPYETAQGYSVIYAEQAFVGDQASVYIRDTYRSLAPLQGDRGLNDLEPNEIDAIAADQRQTLVDLKYLLDLCESLDKIYDHAGSEPQ